MVYKLARHKILLFLIVSTFIITLISGYDYWKQWFIVPFIFFMFYLMGKLPNQLLTWHKLLFMVIIMCLISYFRYYVPR